MTVPPLLNDYQPDIKLKKSTPQYDDTLILIVIDPPDPIEPDDTTLVLVKTLQAGNIITFPIVVLTIVYVYLLFFSSMITNIAISTRFFFHH